MSKKTYKNLIKFKKYYQKEHKLIKVLLLSMILASSLGLVLTYFYSLRLTGITNNSFKQVLIYSLIIIGIIFLHHTFWFLWSKLTSILTNRVLINVKKDLINVFTNTKYTEIKDKTSGYYLERLNDDALGVASFLGDFLGTIIDSLTNFSFLVLIFIFNYKCGILFSTGILILYLIDLLKIKKDLKYTESLKVLNESFNSKMNENFKGIKDIKGLGIKNKIITDTIDISEQAANLQIKKDQTYTFLTRIKTFLQYLIEALLMIYAVGILIPNKEMSIVILLMILNFSGFMYDLVGYISNTKDNLTKSEFKAGRLLEILNNQNIDNFGNLYHNLDSYAIEAINLSYAYPDNLKDQVLKNISFNIKPNTINLFIGNSGSGKSTLFGILSKLLSCEDNKVFIDDKDLNLISEECFKKNIGIINQELFLMNDTILNNLKIVKPSASLKEIREACDKANILMDIERLNNKFNFLVTENGNNLSGGQKQRISIARAILKDSPILLFDEPTSSLDKKNQELFLNTINNLKQNKTILIIAHKFTDYEIFDNIYELKNGDLFKI